MAWDDLAYLVAIEDIEPDLLAVLSLPMTARDGRSLGLLLAALVVVTLPEASVPAPDDVAYSLRVVHDVEVEPGIAASFATQTIPVRSDDGMKVSLLTFSSPNVALLPLLDVGFSAISSSAQLLSADTNV